MVKNASAYPAEFKKTLPDIATTLCDLSKSLKNAEKKIFDKKVLKLFELWDKKNMYTRPFIKRLRKSFKGVEDKAAAPAKVDVKKNEKEKVEQKKLDPELDGEPLSDNDGEPMSDVDGEPMSDEDVDGEPM